MAILRDYYTTGDDANLDFTGVDWRAQSFTGSSSYVITSIKVLLSRTFNPTTGQVTGSIYATDVDGKPTGSPLCSGEINISELPLMADGAEWKEIIFSTTAVIEKGVKYAIVLSANDNSINWRYDSSSPTYAGGNMLTSGNSGSTWSNETWADCMFETWGEINYFKTKGTTTFSINDILRIKDGVDDEWLKVTEVISPTEYIVDRDLAGDYAADSNPEWKKGATIANYGQSGEGGVYMTASDANAPYLSIFDHAGAPWTTINTRLKIGNLNGYLGYTTDLYGIAIGETNKYLKYDPTNGLRLKCDSAELDIGTTSFIRGGQTAYNTGTGFFLGYSTDAHKFSIGNSVGNRITWDGSKMIIKGSLEHDNIHWLTLFESLDGFGKYTDGTGSIDYWVVGDTRQILLTTGDTNNNKTFLSKRTPLTGLFSYDADMRFRTIVYPWRKTNQTIYIIVGIETDMHFGFKIVNDTIYGSCHNGTNQSLTSAIHTYSTYSNFVLTARLIAGSHIEFTVKDVYDSQIYTGTLNTNIPTGEAESQMILQIVTNEDAVKEMAVSYWDLWNGI